jgi:hypothetical protein
MNTYLGQPDPSHVILDSNEGTVITVAVSCPLDKTGAHQPTYAFIFPAFPQGPGPLGAWE